MDEKCGHFSVAKSMQWSQDFILPNSAYLPGIKPKGKTSLPELEFEKAISTERELITGWQTTDRNMNVLSLCVAKQE